MSQLDLGCPKVVKASVKNSRNSALLWEFHSKLKGTWATGPGSGASREGKILLKSRLPNPPREAAPAADWITAAPQNVEHLLSIVQIVIFNRPRFGIGEPGSEKSCTLLKLKSYN